jgi:hypothetical protein
MDMIIKRKTESSEFYVTGAYAQGVEINGKMYLLITGAEEDIFCDGIECNERVEKEYGI